MGGPGRRAFLPDSAPRRLGIRLRHRSGAFKKRRKPGVLYSICSCAYLLHAGAIGRVRAAGTDRKSVVSGKSVSVRVDLGGRRIIKKKIINVLVITHASRITKQ